MTTPIKAKRNMSAPRYQELSGPISVAAAEAEPDDVRTFRMPEATLPEPPPPPAAADFGRGPARRPPPTIADARLQWASGLPTTDRRIYAGWLIEAGHEDLDLALHDAGFPTVTIKHGSGNLVTHTAVAVAHVFVACDGIQTMAEMRGTPDRYGIAFDWRTTDDGRRQSVLRCRVFLQELLTVGYTAPLLLSVKSTLTGDVLTALSRQYAVLDAVDSFRAADGKPPLAPPFYAVALPLGPGDEVTRGANGQTKTLTPPVALIPDPVTKEHILLHWCKRSWAQPIERTIDETIAWSVAESARIAAGEEQKEGWES